MEFSIRDDGHGMNEETQRNLFQPFFSTRGDLGNGLGLYISQEIIERNGGNITVRSQAGIGTEIRLRLPTSPASNSRDHNEAVCGYKRSYRSYYCSRLGNFTGGISGSCIPQEHALTALSRILTFSTFCVALFFQI